MPVFGSILAVLFLGETFYLYHAIGIALIGAGHRRRSPANSSGTSRCGADPRRLAAREGGLRAFHKEHKENDGDTPRGRELTQPTRRLINATLPPTSTPCHYG